MAKTELVRACVWGLMLGDALGLPYEGLSRRRLAVLMGPAVRMRFLFGMGMVSDDTEHCIMTLQAYIQSQGDNNRFARILAWKLRFWILCLPAGVGMATARSIIKLWLGWSPRTSGVYSAGNGPAMRSGILGILVEDLTELKVWVRTSTLISHRDERAYAGALAIALAARCAARNQGRDEFFSLCRDHIDDEILLDLLGRVQQSIKQGQGVRQFAEQFCGDGVSGFIYQTVPVCLHVCWGADKDYLSAMADIIACGGDTDTTAAIAGSILGPKLGCTNLQANLVHSLFEWPINGNWIDDLCASVQGQTKKNLRFPFLLRLPRNVFFLIIVLFHGFRRLFPPY